MDKRKLAVLFVLALASLTALHAQGRVLHDYRGILRTDDTVSPFDLVGKSTEELGLLRNEVYARYGRPFKTQKYVDYFTAQSWYRVVPDFQESWLNDVDRANLALILSFEAPKSPAKLVSTWCLRIVQYVGDSAAIVFSSPTRALLRHGDGGPYGDNPYGESSDQPYLWNVAGDWIVLRDVPAGTGAVALLRLDHERARILEFYFR